jgi:Ca2+-binding RTX toxin-like protein
LKRASVWVCGLIFAATGVTAVPALATGSSASSASKMTIDRSRVVVDPAPDLPKPSPSDLPPRLTAQVAPTADKAFQLHSRPGSSKVIFLDFDGQTVSGSYLNFVSGAVSINLSPFDSDGNAATFSAEELYTISSTWQEVSEDYAPFDVDVTTEDPGDAAIDRAGESDQQFGTRVAITGSTAPCLCGGIGYMGGFDLVNQHSIGQPAAVYSSLFYGNAKYLGDAISHEVGHELSLYHDGTVYEGGYSEYYEGHGNWGPIMGVAYVRGVTQFSKGEYQNASNQQDDFAVIASHGPQILDDEVANDAANAYFLPLSGAYLTSTLFANKFSLLNPNGDVDVYGVTVPAAGYLSAGTTPALLQLQTNGMHYQSFPNTDVRIDVEDGNGVLVASSDPPSTQFGLYGVGLWGYVSDTYVPSGGTYFVFVRATGNKTGFDGYTNYGSSGGYQIQLSWTPRVSGTVFQGTASADILRGTASSEDFHGAGGDDLILPSSGNDVVFGDDGNDTVFGRSGNHYLNGGAGNDTLFGDYFEYIGSLLQFDSGNDEVRGGIGDDAIYGVQGEDRLFGDPGNDLVLAGDGTDAVFGGTGADFLYGENGADLIDGGPDSDLLYGGAGEDHILGGEGDDIGLGGPDDDWIEGGPGLDQIYGEDGTDALQGGLGPDYLFGGSGDDVVFGERGDDTLVGGSGNDSLQGGDANDVVYGESGLDQIAGGNGDDIVLAGVEADHVEGGSGVDLIYGESGNDYLDGGTENDFVYGNEGDDRLLGGPGNDVMLGGPGIDVLRGGDGVDALFGEDGNDFLYGDSGLNFLYGNAGDDTLWGGSEQDTLLGGTGNDTLYGFDGWDVLYGEEGDDSIYGAAGSDYIFSGTGFDKIYIEYGPGTDVVYDFEDGKDKIFIQSAPNLQPSFVDAGTYTIVTVDQRVVYLLNTPRALIDATDIVVYQ